VSTGWLITILGGIVVLGCYLANAFRRIVALEKRVDDLEGKKK
jgi:hypothetical protein